MIPWARPRRPAFDRPAVLPGERVAQLVDERVERLGPREGDGGDGVALAVDRAVARREAGVVGEGHRLDRL